jgi:undecaprenyl-diphosphatase
MYVIFKAIILGLVEGLTEFLPISSTGHLIIVNQFVSFEKNFTNIFDVIIQLGAILAVVIYFWDKIWPFSQKKSADDKKMIYNLWGKALVAFVPAAIIGALFGKKIESALFNPTVVAIALIIGGAIILWVEGKRITSKINSVWDITYKTAFIIGVIQCLSMIPGTSRSAATIVGAMLMGATRVVAAEFSFFLAIPTIGAASAYSFLKDASAFSMSDILILAIGFAASFLSAWAVIGYFMKYISRRDFKPFAYYRIVLGLIVLLYFLFF